MSDTPISQMDADAIAKDDRDCLWHHIKPHAVFREKEQMIVARGEGMRVTDIRGREYLDATSGGVWCVNVGFGRRRIADAVHRQLIELPYYAGSCGTVPAVQYARKLLSRMPGMGKVYFSNSGSEANEKAYKIVRQAASFHGPSKGKYKILFRDRDYHGTTYAAMSSSGQAERTRGFEPMCPGFHEIPHALCYRCSLGKTYPDCDVACARAAEDVILREGPDRVGAVIVEPITAGGGIIVPVDEYYPILQEICRKYGVRMIFDEVVCGFGRTGSYWGHDHFDVAPDMVTLGKGIASSYAPLSATVVRDEIYDIFLNDPADEQQRLNFFRDISTYGGCTASFAAALENMAILEEEDLVENSRVMGVRLMDRLRELSDMPHVGDVRGRGLFCGVEIVEDKNSRQPVSEATMNRLVGAVAARGVLIGRTNSSLPGLNTTLNFAPALIITAEEVDIIVDAVKAAMESEF